MTWTSPVGPGLTQGRTDQGVDYSGAGPLYAVGSGTIESIYNNGWPGGTFIALALDNPIDALHRIVYYAEDITPGVAVGDKVTAGQEIGRATGGSSGVELGWGAPGAIGEPLNAQEHGAYSGSGATPEGTSFLAALTGAAVSNAGAGAVNAGGGAANPTLSAIESIALGQMQADQAANDPAVQVENQKNLLTAFTKAGVTYSGFRAFGLGADGKKTAIGWGGLAGFGKFTLLNQHQVRVILGALFAIGGAFGMIVATILILEGTGNGGSNVAKLAGSVPAATKVAGTVAKVAPLAAAA